MLKQPLSSSQVASSVVCTIMILNYHHRLANTHSMPKWISIIFLQVINTSSKQFVIKRFNTNSNHPTHLPTQWLPWILRMSRPGRPLTKKSIQLQVINPSIVFLKYNIETPDQCGCQPAKNLDLNSISSMATSDKDGQVGGGRQELQLSACQRSRHGR